MWSSQPLRPALVLLALLSLLVGVAYPLVTWGVAGALFPARAHGTLVSRNGQPVGSALIGQSSADPAHFWSRPSATSPMPNNAANSSGSNMGPLNPALVDAVKGRVEALHKADPGNQQPIPVDLVTASASGLDPHISPAAAHYQAPRVARARNLPVPAVEALVDAHVERPLLPFLGEPVVNVLRLNLALEGEGGVTGPVAAGGGARP